MSESGRYHASECEWDASESLRDALHTLLGSAPAPRPELSDEELLAKIRESADKAPLEDLQ